MTMADSGAGGAFHRNSKGARLSISDVQGASVAQVVFVEEYIKLSSGVVGECGQGLIPEDGPMCRTLASEAKSAEVGGVLKHSRDADRSRLVPAARVDWTAGRRKQCCRRDGAVVETAVRVSACRRCVQRTGFRVMCMWQQQI